MNCLISIRQLYEELTKTEKKIANVISNEPEHVIGLTIHELAKYSDTSPASVARFAKRIGFDSYGDMKIELARNIEAESTPEINTLLKSDDSLEIISKKIVNNIGLTLEETLGLMDFDNIVKAVEALRAADTIYLFGVGASAVVAQDMQQKLVRINKRCVFHTDYHLGLASSTHIKPEDVVVAFSYQGQTKEVHEAIRQAKINGATCIGITRCLTNPIHDLVDILIGLPNIEQGIRIGAVQSRYAQLLVVDILFAGIAKENFEVTEGYLVKTQQLIEKLKEK
ncbi:MAG: MurR/RpiR family transcriptional regulator [Epulopiscium sp.]|nr:MurR/RpiR family transcriptional regulator [Candidatus Epulonipiscium sp.]